MQPDRLAEIVIRAIETAVDPMLERIAVAEARLEMKTAEMVPVLAAVVELTKENGVLRERVAVLETRPLQSGQPGKDGDPGPPGKDGTAGLTYLGVYQDGKTYELGELVTWGGSTWHCNESTTAKPGESKAWALIVKRGRDGKDGGPGPEGKPGRNGKDWNQK